MKKSLIALVLCALVSISYSQSKEKIKGNRSVTVTNTEINSFHTLSLDEDFEVDLIYNKIPSVEVETDENLHECIEFNVKDSVLYLNKTKKITSKKKLNIKVIYDDYLKHIKITEDAELNGLTPIYLDKGSLSASGSSKIALTLKTGDFDFVGSDKSKIKLNLTTDSCKITISNYCKIEALINTTKLVGTLKDKSYADIEGDCNMANITLENNSEFDGKNFTISSCNIGINSDSDAYLEVTKDVTIEATGDSAIYLYQNPQITINKMTDTSKLEKKVK